MVKPSYRAGIIGLGFIGGADQVSGDALGQLVSNMDGTHFEAYSKNPRIELVAGSSRDAGRRARFVERSGGARTYADWQEMLAREELDIVSVATYAPQHAEIVVACAERRIPVIYCEKPVATRLPDAERMLEACRRSGSLLVVNHNRRFNPLYRRLRDLIAGGGLGQLTSGLLQWGSGRLGNVGTHTFDTVRMLTGREIEAVSGHLDLTGRPDCRGPAFRDPGGWGMLRMTGGLIVLVDAADEGKIRPQIVLNGTLGRAVTGMRDVRLEYHDGRHETWPSPGREPTSMDHGVEEIIAALDGTRPFPWTPDEAVKTFEAIVAFHASHSRHAVWTQLPLAGDDRNIEVQSG